MVRKDVEHAIASADSFDGFISKMQSMGYTVKYGPRVQHIAVRHQNAQRNVRLDRLDERFSEPALREYYRQLNRLPVEMREEYKEQTAQESPPWVLVALQPSPKKVRYRGSFPKHYRKATGFMVCYYHYCSLLRKAYHGKSTKRCYYLLRDDFIQFNRYMRQCSLLWEHGIETPEQLLEFKQDNEDKIKQLAACRRVLYRQKDKSEPERQEQIAALTKQIRTLRHEVYICSDIEQDYVAVQEKLRQAELAAQEERNEVKEDEYKRRGSRPDGERGPAIF